MTIKTIPLDPVFSPVNPPSASTLQGPGSGAMSPNLGVGSGVVDRWAPDQAEDYAQAQAHNASQSVGAVLSHLRQIAGQDLFDLLLAARQEVARRALADEAALRSGDEGAEARLSRWSQLLQDRALGEFNEAKVLGELRETVESLEKTENAKAVSVSRMLQEVQEQLGMLRLLRSTVMKDGVLLVNDPSEIRGVVTAASTTLTALMRFQSDLIDLQQVEQIEQALVRAAEGLPSAEQKKFVEYLRGELETVH